MLRALLIALLVPPYTLLAGPVALLLARLLGSAGPLYRLSRLGVRLTLFLAGTRLVLEGGERLGGLRNTVVMANHVSHLDAPILFQILDVDFKAILKKELMRLPVFARVMRNAGFIEVDRRDRAQAAEAILKAGRSLQQGNTFLVFPEGTRSPTGELGEFKRGGFVAALNAGSRIVPVAVHGTRELMPRGGFRILPGTVRVRVLDPVEAGRYSYEDRDKLVEEVRGRIAAALDDMGRTA